MDMKVGQGFKQENQIIEQNVRQTHDREEEHRCIQQIVEGIRKVDERIGQIDGSARSLDRTKEGSHQPSTVRPVRWPRCVCRSEKTTNRSQ